jgi:hypothetical protein
MFDCPHAREHASPSDALLLTLPRLLIDAVPDYPVY